jgi:hypothetical protein
MIHLGAIEVLARERAAAMQQRAEHARLIRLARQYQAAARPEVKPTAKRAAHYERRGRRSRRHEWVLLRLLSALVGARGLVGVS